jgi:hypothetical protein
LSVIGKKNGIFSSKEERCNFLAKERQKRVEMEKIHGKTIDSSQSVKKKQIVNILKKSI